MSFGHHLGSNEDVDAAFLKVLQYTQQAALAALAAHVDHAAGEVEGIR